MTRALYTLARDTLAACPDPMAASFLADLPESDGLETRAVAQAPSPVSPLLDRLGPAAPATARLVAAIRKAAPAQAWRQPYGPEDFGADFVTGASWFPLADAEGPLVLTSALVEVMVLDANLAYPLHSHQPEELYLVLAGAVWWQAEGDPTAPAWRHPGAVMHHPPNRPHSLKAGDHPALLLTLWRGGGFEMPTIL